MQWVYVLSKENIDGVYKTLYLDEKSLDLIIHSESQGYNPDLKELHLL